MMVLACDEKRENRKHAKVIMGMNVEGRRRRRGKKKRSDTIESGVGVADVCVFVEDVKDQDKWISRTRVAYPK